MHRGDKNLDVQVARSCTNKLGFDVLRNHTHTHKCIFPTITSSGWKKGSLFKNFRSPTHLWEVWKTKEEHKENRCEKWICLKTRQTRFWERKTFRGMINDISTPRKQNSGSQFQIFPYNPYIKGFVKIFNNLFALKIKN